jgi:ABC-2 type transport system permease protein
MSIAAVLAPRIGAKVLVDAIRAELSKLRTLPATWLILGGTVALAAVLAFFFASRAAESGGTNLDSLDIAMAAVPYAQAGLVVFGIAATCSEYVGGQIRTTLIAIPHRTLQRLAATVALVAISLPVAAITVFATVGVTALVLGENAVFPALGTIARSVGSATVCLVLMTIFSAAIGGITRHALPTAGGVVVYLMVVSPLLLEQTLAAYLLPDIAGYTLWFTAQENAPPTAVAWLVVLGWTLAAYIPSAVIARRRDT